MPEGADAAMRPDDKLEATEKTGRRFFEFIRELCGARADDLVGEFGAKSIPMTQNTLMELYYNLPPQEGHPMDLPPEAILEIRKTEGEKINRKIYFYYRDKTTYHMDLPIPESARPAPKTKDEAWYRATFGGLKQAFRHEDGLPVMESDLLGVIEYLKDQLTPAQITAVERRAG